MVMTRFGAKFSKDKGDTERLARILQEHAVPAELQALLQNIVKD